MKGQKMNDIQAIHDFSDRFTAVLERGDADAARTFYARDARIWHNFDSLCHSHVSTVHKALSACAPLSN